ncbi:MAG: DHHA1 domain-containing protein, partial [Candidatus Saccharibacteria bacterium]
ACMDEQKERGRKSFKSDDAFALEQLVAQILQSHPSTEFMGYQTLDWESEIVSIIQDGQEVDSAKEGEAVVVLLETPFYAESGGQVADHGVIKGPDGQIDVTSVFKVAGWILHRGNVSGVLSRGQQAKAFVTDGRRKDTAANHTATHLLHQALRQVLGEHAQQKGSLVEPERLRFDFSHFSSLSEAELDAIEEIVNKKIWELIPVSSTQTTLDEARKRGAMALFGEKYGEKVRMVEIEEFSRELCGGTHVQNTGEIGLFKIVNEGSIGAGLRRIEAVTARQALEHLKSADRELKKAAAVFKCSPQDIAERGETLQKQLRETEKELETLKAGLEKEKAAGTLDAAVEIGGIKVLIAQVEASDMNSLRQNAEMLRDKLGQSVVLLGSKLGDKAGFVVFVAKELNAKGLHAGEIVGQVAKVAGGGGGGRPDMAQAGGKDPSKLGEALDKGREVITGIIG